MADEKKSPRKDGQVEELPRKKISKEDAEQVKGGMGGTHMAKIDLDYRPVKG